MISDKCFEQAYHIYEAHEYGHWAAEAAFAGKKELAEINLNLINEELYDANLNVEAKMELNGLLAEARKLVKAESQEAVLPLRKFLDRTKRLMFEVAVECACKEPTKELSRK